MEHQSILYKLLDIPIEFLWGFLAICGGIARYLSSYQRDTKPFSLGLLLASAFIAGFSGYMFALLGESMNQPQPITHIMAGVGGFFGEQTLKYIFEWLKER